MDNIYKYLNNINIKSESMRKYFNELQEHRGWCSEQPIKLRERSIINGLVNSIRHNAFTYNSDIKKIRKLNTRNNNNYVQYKNAVLEKIALEYPSLREECDRQKKPLNLVKVIKKKGNNLK